METEDVVHVLRRVHRAVRPRGYVLDAHPLSHEIAVRAGERGLGFVDTRKFSAIVEAMDARVQQVIAEGLFDEVTTVRRLVAERFDTVAELLEVADEWVTLRLPAAVRRRLLAASDAPIELLDTVSYRLLRKRARRRRR